MKHHVYSVTIHHREDKDGNPVNDRSCAFFARSHDELIGIVERAQGSGRFESDADAAAFASGLKLLGEVMLQYRKKPGFDELAVPFGEFMKGFKAMMQPRESHQDG